MFAFLGFHWNTVSMFIYPYIVLLITITLKHVFRNSLLLNSHTFLAFIIPLPLDDDTLSSENASH